MQHGPKPTIRKRKARSVSVTRATALAVALTGSVSMALPSVATGGQQDPTRVDDLSASVSGGLVRVQGTATFVDVPVVVGTDWEGDVPISGIGTDLTRAAISRPDPFDGHLLFTLSIGDQPEEVWGIPEAIRYTWRMRIGEGEAQLFAWRTQQLLAPGSLDPVFRITTPTATATPISGRMLDGVVEFSVPMALAGAAAGTAVTPVGPSSADIRAEINGLIAVLDSMSFGAYAIPGPVVRLGIAPAGTPPGSIPRTSPATVEADGSFEGALSISGLAPGTYTVLAEACYGSSNCGAMTREVIL